MAATRRSRVVGLCLALLFLLVAFPLSASAGAPPDVAVCTSYRETGFMVCDDAQARFGAAFTRWGIQHIGYPISDRYEQNGFVMQAFQKGIMQWHADNGTVSLINIFDDLHRNGYDSTLHDNFQTPYPLPDDWDGNRPFVEVVRQRQSLLSTRPALKRAYFSVGDPLTFFGLPTSDVQDMGNHYAIRLQRAVLQEWKEDVPWAKVGEVTVSNGGEIAWSLGILPAASELPTAAPPAPPADPYAGLTVDALRARSYGTESSIERVRIMAQTSAFTRYEIRYPSDGLMIGGFMNIPTGQGPFPVILVNHGYVNQSTYSTLAYTTPYADALARAGYLVLHTNYRNHRGSDSRPDLFRVGYAIDVLNLLELAKQLPEANPAKIGMWGHSMGGAVTIRALTVTDDVRAAVLYGPMTSDETQTWEFSRTRYADQQDLLRQSFPVTPEQDPALYQRISPINHLGYITAPVAIHHSEQDATVPFGWSTHLRDTLTNAGKSVDFYAYQNQPHNFTGAGYDLFLARTIEFFDKYLK